MNHPIRFHVLLLPNQPWPELRRRALHCEALGFDLIGIADHFIDWTKPEADWFESWSVMAALADATSTIRLTTLVSQIPLRNPAMLARQALTLDHVSNGRIEVGLGTGLTIDPSYEMTGIPNWEIGERVDRFAEYVAIVEALLANEQASFAGRFYQIDGAWMRPRPIQQPHPPILIAALGPRMIRLAAKHAQVWNSLSFKEEPAAQLAETAERIDLMRSACQAIGRDPHEVRISYTLFDATARHRGGSIGYLESTDAFRAQVEPLIALGVTDIGLYYPIDPAQMPAFEAIATAIFPDLRSQGS